MGCGDIGKVTDKPAQVPDAGIPASSKDMRLPDMATADIGPDVGVDAMPDAGPDAMHLPIREYSSKVTRDITDMPTITVEVAVDLDKQEFAYSTSDRTYYTLFVDGTYYKGIDLGSMCIINVTKNADYCKWLENDENSTVTFFMFPEFVKVCKSFPDLFDKLLDAFKKGKPLELEINELTASYIRTAAGDFLSDKSVFIYNDPGLIYTWTYGNIGEEKDAVANLRAEIDKHYAGRNCQRIEQ
jgi:hypothetical protein